MRIENKAILAIGILMLALAPALLYEESDAKGTWWNSTTDITLMAGSTFNFGDLEVDGKKVTNVSVQSDLAGCFTVIGNSISALFPSTTTPGDYDAVIIAKANNTTQWMRFIFHITENTNNSSGYAANAPQINDIDVKSIGNNSKMAYITLDTKNVDTVRFDFNDGIITDDIMLKADNMSTTHRYSGEGLFAVNIIASNSYGTIQKVVVYNSGEGEETTSEGQVVEDEKTHPMWILYALIGIAILAGIVFLLTRTVYCIPVAIIFAIAAAVDFFMVL